MLGIVVYSLYTSSFIQSSRASLPEIGPGKHVTSIAARVYKHRNYFPKLTLGVLLFYLKNVGGA